MLNYVRIYISLGGLVICPPSLVLAKRVKPLPPNVQVKCGFTSFQTCFKLSPLVVFKFSALSLKKSIERIHTHLKPRYNVKQDQPFLRLMHATLAIMDLYLRVELRVFTSFTPHSTKMRSVPFVCSIEHFCLMFLSTKKVLFSLKNVINFYD